MVWWKEKNEWDTHRNGMVCHKPPVSKNSHYYLFANAIFPCLLIFEWNKLNKQIAAHVHKIIKKKTNTWNVSSYEAFTNTHKEKKRIKQEPGEKEKKTIQSYPVTHVSIPGAECSRNNGMRSFSRLVVIVIDIEFAHKTIKSSIFYELFKFARSVVLVRCRWLLWSEHKTHGKQSENRKWSTNK